MTPDCSIKNCVACRIQELEEELEEANERIEELEHELRTQTQDNDGFTVVEGVYEELD